MKSVNNLASGAIVAAGLLVTTHVAFSQEVITGTEVARKTGLPKTGEWTFSLDAGAGAFSFDNSLYSNARPDPSGDLSDDWIESYVKAALSADLPSDKGGAFFGKLSAVGSRTFSAPPTLVGEDASSFMAEDVYVGWRSGTSLGIGEDAFQITLGRAPYQIGHGMLLWDGASDGGSRGGFWSGPRKAWEYAAIGRFKAKGSTLEAFYVDRDEIDENDTGTKLSGVNYELAIGEHSTFGLSWFRAGSDTLEARDGMDVYDGRAYTAPLRALPDLSFEIEYALEENDDLSATAWTAQVAYKMSNVGWTPQLSYRYAEFEGDDPTTQRSEAFDSLFPGFYDWGTWWQGEIAGEYFLSNSNLISHQVRLHLAPAESLGLGLMFFDFMLDQPASFAPGVTSDSVAAEIDGYVDWKINDNFTASFVLAYTEPDDAIEQGFGRTDSFTYGMVYLAYAY
jgi:hypothetical protein